MGRSCRTPACVLHLGNQLADLEEIGIRSLHRKSYTNLILMRIGPVFPPTLREARMETFSDTVEEI
jgi:hypothetical protein